MPGSAAAGWPLRDAPGTSNAPFPEPVAQGGEARRLGVAFRRASAAAAPKPTMPGTFSVPA